MKIDVHTHILPERWPDLQEKYGYGGFLQLEHPDDGTGCAHMMRDGELFRKVKPNCWDAATRVAECDGQGVDVQVLSTVPVLFNYWAKARDADDWARFLNDDLAETVAAHPKRFIGLATLPMQDAALAAKELERAVTELGFAGAQIGSNINGANLGDENVFPVFEAAEALGAAIFVHPWEMVGRERMPKYWLPWLVGMPAETALAICSMIFSGVFERLPRLRVLFAHGGGSFPATVGRIQHGFDVRPDLCAVDNAVSPRDYLGKFYVDSLVHDEAMLRLLLEVMGESSIALGTDYPFPLGELEPGRLIESADLSDSVKQALLADNALRFLGRSRSDFVD